MMNIARTLEGERPMPAIDHEESSRVVEESKEGDHYLLKIYVKTFLHQVDATDATSLATIGLQRYMRRFNDTERADLKHILRYVDEQNLVCWHHCPQYMKQSISDVDLQELQSVCEGLGVELNLKSLTLHV